MIHPIVITETAETAKTKHIFIYAELFSYPFYFYKSFMLTLIYHYSIVLHSNNISLKVLATVNHVQNIVEIYRFSKHPPKLGNAAPF